MPQCKICGHNEEHQLFTHIRDAHEMRPQEYVTRFATIELMSPGLEEFMKRRDFVVAADGEIRERVPLGDAAGSVFSVPLFVKPGVPKRDRRFVFPASAAQVATALLGGHKILLVGPTGLGKSTLIEQLANRLRWPVVRVSASVGVSEADLLGEWVAFKGETRFNYGFLPRAMRLGAICLVDEINGLEPDVSFAIHQVLEDNGSLTLMQNGGEIITPDKNFRFVATTNSLGAGDDSALYAGVKMMNQAFLDRYGATFRLDYPLASEEYGIIKSRVPECHDELIYLFIQIANAVRNAVKDETLYCTFSTRRLINMARNFVLFGSLETAVRLTVLNKFENDVERDAIREICQRYLGGRADDTGEIEEQVNAKQS